MEVRVGHGLDPDSLVPITLIGHLRRVGLPSCARFQFGLPLVFSQLGNHSAVRVDWVIVRC